MNTRSPIVFSEEEKVIVEIELLSKQPWLLDPVKVVKAVRGDRSKLLK
jgi:hypothetical protein